MIALQQTVLEQAAQQARAGQYVEAWATAASDARARAYVRYHAGDLEGALFEARKDPRDAFLCAGEVEPHPVAADRFRLHHLGVVGAVVRAPLVAQQLPGKDHVLGRDLAAVGEAGGGIERERHV